MHNVVIQDFEIGKGQPLVFVAGPCVIEGEKETLEAAHALKEIFAKHKVPWIFKSSYDKANRTSIHSFRGPGLEEGMRILSKVKEEVGVPILTDVHTPDQATAAGSVCDVIQIPAFLCRQTDLVVAAAKTPAAIFVKKGQFMAPWDMKNVIAKITESGNERIVLVERGFTFGYANLVSDMRSIFIMQAEGRPVCFDATHSVQLPGALGSSTGGQREFIPLLAKAAVASGANVLFMEAHPNPAEGKSDAASMLSFDELQQILPKLLKLYEVIHS